MKDNVISISWDEYYTVCRRLARKVAAYSESTKTPIQAIIGVARGGLYAAAILARELDCRMVDTICVKGYEGLNRQPELTVIKHAHEMILNSQGFGCVVVDDLVDTGATGKIVRRYYPKAAFVAPYIKEVATCDLWVKQFKQTDWVEFPWEEYRPFKGEG